MTKKNKTLLITCGKWCLAALILALIFRNLNLNEFTTAFKSVNKTIFLGLIFLYVMANYVCESLSTHFLTLSFSKNSTIQAQLNIRGKAYFLGAAHQSLGLGSHIYFLKQKYQLSLATASSLFVIIFFTDGLILCFTGLLFLPFTEVSIPNEIVVTIYVAIFSTYATLFFATKSGRLNRLSWFKSLQTELQTLRPNYMVSFITWRAAYFITVFLVMIVGLSLFETSVPYVAALALLPICILIGFLPITPFGIGTFPAAMSFFFGDFSNSEAVVAFTLCYLVTISLCRLPVGLYFWLKPD